MAVKYDKDVDYQALINEAVGKGDYRTAAQYEQQRNAKIADLDASGTNTYNATTTNKYGGWLDQTDYAAQLKDMMAAGANATDVANTLGKRVEKASNTEGMSQWVYDDVYKDAMDYITNYTSKPTFDSSSYEDDRPTYTSSYSSQIDQLLNEILNREDFSYNAETDPLFQQYQKQYQREGQRSMNDTLASVASSAGGMNSYAITAAQQANDYYASQLGDKIPELYQMAYEMYLNDKASKVEDLGLLQSMDSTQYNRYRDTMSDWRDDRDFAYTQYRDDMGDYHWQKNYNYNAEQDDIYNKYRQDQADITNNANANNTAYNRVMDMLDSGVMPDEALLKQVDITPEQARAYIDNGYGYNRAQDEADNASDAKNDAFDRAIKMLQSGMMPRAELLEAADIPVEEAKKVYDGIWTVDDIGGGGGGYTPKGEYPEKDDSEDDTQERNEEVQEEKKGALTMKETAQITSDLGIANLNATTLNELVKYGGILDDGNGHLKWNTGWSAQNYLEKLAAARKIFPMYSHGSSDRQEEY